jgi:hypothetical protein
VVDITIKKVKISQVKPNPDNPRTIKSKDMDRLIKSLQEFPEMLSLREIVVDENMMVLGGNMRLRALKKIGSKEVTAKIVTGLTPKQKREFIVKDNAAFGEWDMDLLSSWDDLPLVDWGIGIPEHWKNEGIEKPESLISKSFNENTGGGMDVGVEGGSSTSNEDKFPVTFIFNANEYSRWEAVKERLGVKGDKSALLKLIGDQPC